MDGFFSSRPAEHSAPRPPGVVNAADLAFAARDACAEVLPAAWRRLPDGQDTALVLAGTIANHYAALTPYRDPTDTPWPPRDGPKPAEASPTPDPTAPTHPQERPPLP